MQDQEQNPLVQFIKKYNRGYGKKMSQQSRLLVTRLMSHMENGRMDYKKIAHTIQKETVSKLPTGGKYHLIDENIRAKIDELDVFTKREFVVSSSVSSNVSRTIRIFSCRKHDEHKTEDPCEQEMESIYIWFYLANHFAGKTCSNKLDIYLYMTDLQKMLPERDGEVLSADHANTAFTFACNISEAGDLPNEIYVYRQEEWFKVFLHETFHSLGIDFAAMPQEPSAAEITGTIYRVPVTDLRFYETYTESWAELMQVMIHAFLHGESNSERISLFETHIFEHEAPFAVFQTVKILNHYSMTYTDLFDGRLARKYREDTPVLAYYIIKSVFMNHASEFMEWCMDHNPGPFFLFFKKTPENIRALVEFLRTHCKTAEYLEKIDRMDAVLESGRVPFHIGESMRMTVFRY
jgi:hypothetical protein